MFTFVLMWRTLPIVEWYAGSECQLIVSQEIYYEEGYILMLAISSSFHLVDDSIIVERRLTEPMLFQQ